MIAIPNMSKPKECIECEFSCLWVNGSTHCMVDGEELFCDGIPQRHDCPLIEVSDEIWEALKPKVETMSLAERGWITDDSNT